MPHAALSADRGPRTLPIVIRRFAALAIVLATVAGVTPAAADDETTTDAKQQEAKLHFTAGVNLLRDPERPRYDEAYVEFKRAYELVKSPNILGNIGLCALKLERDGEALDAYTRYLAEAQNLDADERAQTERDVTTLKAQLAKITVESKPDGALIHDARITGRGESVTNIYGPISGPTELGLRRGHHIIKARFPDGREVSWELDIKGGESHVFEQPVAAPQPPLADRPGMTPTVTRPIPTSVYIGAGTTAALGIGAIVTGTLALSAASRYDDANNGTQAARAEDLRGDAQTLNVVSDVLLAGVVVGAVVTTFFYLTRPSVTTSSPTTGSNPGTSPKASGPLRSPGSSQPGYASSLWVTRF